MGLELPPLPWHHTLVKYFGLTSVDRHYLMSHKLYALKCIAWLINYCRLGRDDTEPSKRSLLISVRTNETATPHWWLARSPCFINIPCLICLFKNQDNFNQWLFSLGLIISSQYGYYYVGERKMSEVKAKEIYCCALKTTACQLSAIEYLRSYKLRVVKACRYGSQCNL